MNVTSGHSIGNSLIRTYAHGTQLPLIAADAVADGWLKAENCNEHLGFLYTNQGDAPSEEHPLGLYFTATGKLAGVQVTIYGENKDVGDAAQPALVEKGFWKVNDGMEKTWHMDVSFRSPAEMCGDTSSDEILGDRLVVNQDTISYALPTVAGEARSNNWTEGSCFNQMGQHHFYDFNTAPEMSWASDALLPVVVMYDPPFDDAGTINAIFLTTPVSQPGSSAWNLLSGKADWESPALTPAMMCKNWCDDECTWESSWATMHLFTKKDYADLECPGVSKFDPIGISCTGVTQTKK
jgi:hypothetical protein